MPVKPPLPVKSEWAESSERPCVPHRFCEQIPDDPRADPLWLVKSAVQAVLCIAIPLGVWAFIIRWSTENVNEKIPQHDMMKEVKKFEIKQFDFEELHKSMGIGSERT